MQSRFVREKYTEVRSKAHLLIEIGKGCTKIVLMLDEAKVIMTGLYVQCYKSACTIDLVLSHKPYCACHMGILVSESSSLILQPKVTI